MRTGLCNRRYEKELVSSVRDWRSEHEHDIGDGVTRKGSINLSTTGVKEVHRRVYSRIVFSGGLVEYVS